MPTILYLLISLSPSQCHLRPDPHSCVCSVRDTGGIMGNWSMDSPSAHHYHLFWCKHLEYVLDCPTLLPRDLRLLHRPWPVCQHQLLQRCNSIFTQCYCSRAHGQPGKKRLRRESGDEETHLTERTTATHQIRTQCIQTRPICYWVWGVMLYSHKSSNSCVSWMSCSLIFQNLDCKINLFPLIYLF